MPLVIDPKTGKRYNFGWTGPGKPDVKGIVEQLDPAKEIERQAKGWMAEKLLPAAEFLGTGFGMRDKPITEPFDELVEKGRTEDELTSRSFDIPSDYKPVKGINEYIAENITPADIALSAAPVVGKGLKAAGKTARASSEVGAVGKDISQIVKAEKLKKSPASLLDNDLAGARPRDIGTNPRAQGTNPRAKEIPELEITSMPEDELMELESKAVDKSNLFKTFDDETRAPGGAKKKLTEPKESAADFELRQVLGDEEFNKTRQRWLVKKGGTPAGKGARKEAQNIEYKMSQTHSRSKPRYKTDELDFESDFDRAAYIIQGKNKSKAHDDILQHLMEQTGKTEEEIRLHGDTVRQAMKGIKSQGGRMSVPNQGARKSVQQLAKAHGNVGNPTQRAASQGGIPPQAPPPNQPPGSTPPQPPGGGQNLGGAPNPPGGSNIPQNSRPKATLWQNLLGTPKSLKSMIDLPVLRQTVVPALTHPIDVGIPAIKAGAKSMFSDKAYGNVLDDIANRPYHDIYSEFDMAIPDTGLRQQFPATWAEEIPGIGRIVEKSEDAYDASLKTARANMADPLIDEAVAKYAPFQGPSQHGLSSPVPSSELQGIANYVNDFSGYGTLGKFERAADPLAAIMYSPRMLASRAQMLNPVNYLGGSRWGSVGANEARKSMAKFGAGTVGGLAGLDAASDDVDVSWDPRSSDFASAQIGDTTFDTLGGLKSLINFGSRELTGQSTSTKGNESTYEVGRKDPLLNFARSKLAPGLPAMIGDVTLGEGKDVVGQEIDRDSYLPWAANQISPMFPQGVYEAFDESGPVAGSLSALPGIFGIGSSSYDRSGMIKMPELAEMPKMRKR